MTVVELMMASDGRSDRSPKSDRESDQVSPEVREVLHMLRMLEKGEGKPVKAANGKSGR